MRSSTRVSRFRRVYLACFEISSENVGKHDAEKDHDEDDDDRDVTEKKEKSANILISYIDRPGNIFFSRCGTNNFTENIPLTKTIKRSIYTSQTEKLFHL